MPPERSAGPAPANGWRALPALALALALAACGGGGGGAPADPATTDPGTRVDPTVYNSTGSAALAQAVEGTSVRRLQLALGPRTLSYTARAGHLAVPDASGRTQASMFHVSYTLEGMAAAQRPVMFFYNGGPGSATVWLHLGSFGPRRIAVGTPVPPAPPPYPLVDNTETLLDAADLVFVDAVGAGYSQAVSPYTNQSFWGVDADAALFRDFVRRWLAQNGREAAPKYLYGESYGGPRTAVLASLLETAGVRLAGVVLQSPALDYNGNCGLDDGTPTDCRGHLPSYGAAAEYHHRAQPAQPDLPAYMDLLRGYAAGTYQPAVDTALQNGQPLSATVAAQLAGYTGLSAALWQAQRVVWPGMFMGNLLPGRRLGRYDARFSAPSTSQSDPSIAHIDASFYQRLNEYLRQELGFQNASTYVMLGSAIETWNFSHAGRALPDTLPDLAAARLLNPQLRVLAMSGYHDLATPFHQTEIDLARLPGGAAASVVRNYAGGHMSYLDDATRRQQRADLGRWLAGEPLTTVAVQPEAQARRALAAPPAAADTATPAAALPEAALQTPHRGPWVPPAARAAARLEASAHPAQHAQSLQAQAEARLRLRFEAAAGPAGRLTRDQARAAGMAAVARALDEQGAPPQASLSAGDWLAHLRAVRGR
jgi:carboxypeptidase C (cathepsin A)